VSLETLVDSSGSDGAGDFLATSSIGGSGSVGLSEGATAAVADEGGDTKALPSGSNNCSIMASPNSSSGSLSRGLLGELLDVAGDRTSGRGGNDAGFLLNATARGTASAVTFEADTALPAAIGFIAAPSIACSTRTSGGGVNERGGAERARMSAADIFVNDTRASFARSLTLGKGGVSERAGGPDDGLCGEAPGLVEGSLGGIDCGACETRSSARAALS
jgi:hypothetical protein